LTQLEQMYNKNTVQMVSSNFNVRLPSSQNILVRQLDVV